MSTSFSYFILPAEPHSMGREYQQHTDRAQDTGMVMDKVQDTDTGHT